MRVTAVTLDIAGGFCYDDHSFNNGQDGSAGNPTFSLSSRTRKVYVMVMCCKSWWKLNFSLRFNFKKRKWNTIIRSENMDFEYILMDAFLNQNLQCNVVYIYII